MFYISKNNIGKKVPIEGTFLLQIFLFQFFHIVFEIIKNKRRKQYEDESYIRLR